MYILFTFNLNINSFILNLIFLLKKSCMAALARVEMGKKWWAYMKAEQRHLYISLAF